LDWVSFGVPRIVPLVACVYACMYADAALHQYGVMVATWIVHVFVCNACAYIGDRACMNACA
jgi:hypothetical protein